MNNSENITAEPVQEYIFSFVIAVYNCEPFLNETVNSIFAQKYKNIENTVQVILVDDCSTDSSLALCEELAKEHSNTTVVRNSERRGAAYSRNVGMQSAKGKYITFTDADDKISNKTLKNVFSFFEKNYESTDVVAISEKIIGIDKAKPSPSINNSAKASQMFYIPDSQPNCDISASCCFFKAEALEGVSFDESMKYGEDRKFFLDVMLKKHALGVVRDAVYYFRMRESGENSLTQSSALDPLWYNEHMEKYLLYFLNRAKKEYGFVPKFIQKTLFTALCSKMMSGGDITQLMSESDAAEYKRMFQEVISCIDDGIIMTCDQIYIEHKFYCLREKYALQGILPQITPIGSSSDCALTIGNAKVCRLSQILTKVDFVDLEKGKIIIEGSTSMLPIQDFSVSLYITPKGGESFFVPCEITTRDTSKFLNGEKIIDGKTFVGTFEPANNNISRYRIRICCILSDGTVICKKRIRFGKMCSVGDEYKWQYYAKHGMSVYTAKNAFVYEKCDKKAEKKMERRFQKELWNTKKSAARKAVLVRKLVRFIKPKLKKDIWLISDRIYKSDDNGEAFFKYCMEKKDKRVKPYFVMSECDDYKRMVKIGPVVKFFSWKHKLLHLLGGKLISSQGSSFIINPFYGWFAPYRDLMQTEKFIFLQHGVIKDDLSSWLSRYSKRIDGFITSAQPEYQSILDYNYYYTEKEVWLTGLPRHDYLYNDSKRYITIMPTWRKYLCVGKGQVYRNGIWQLDDSFKRTDFYRFYNGLLNSPRLLEAAKKYNYTICFMPHPNIIEYIDLFERNEQTKFLSAQVPYKQVFAESDLVISDYSSVVFDFIYLRKPVVYSQFDADTFFSGSHVYTKGYFDYERDGFGEVAYDLDSTIDLIIEYMQNNCQLKDKYRQRIDEFLSFNDKNNCERIFNKIIELNEPSDGE